MKPSSLLTIAIAAGVALLLGGLGWLALTRIAPEEKAAVTTARRDDQQTLIAARAAIQTRFPQADAITYGKTFTSWVGADPAICGEVDIVEVEDSYQGQERFIYFQDALLLEELDGSDELDARWDDLCKAA